MSNYEWKTKKEQIIEDARKDPFQKIEHLAKRANTTPRYVRTILSEANLSLMNLRREYARKMEKNNQSNVDNIILSYLFNSPFMKNVDSNHYKNIIFNNPDDFNDLEGNIKSDYYSLSLVHNIKDNPLAVSTVLISRTLDKIKDIGPEIENIISFIQKNAEKNSCRLSNIIFDVELAAAQTAELLESSPLDPIIRARQFITETVSGENKILLLNYFNAEKITISITPGKGFLINKKYDSKN
ncbi:MAG: hypothetical protein ACQESS_06430 [Bacillota bacterium]